MMQIIFYGLISKRIFRTVMIIFGIRIRYSAVYMEKLVQNQLFVRALLIFAAVFEINTTFYYVIKNKWFAFVFYLLRFLFTNKIDTAPDTDTTNISIQIRLFDASPVLAVCILL